MSASLQTASSQGSVYLVCFDSELGAPDNPKGKAGHSQHHYRGWAEDVELRMAEHRAGRSARILAACVEQSIAFGVVWAGAGVDRNFERRLKRQHNAWRHCPRCEGRRVRAGPAQNDPVPAGRGRMP